MTAYRVIDKLEIVVREGVWLPFGWRAVNADRVLDLVEKLRSAMPDDSGRGKKATDNGHIEMVERPIPPMKHTTTATEDDLVARAQARADALIAEAQAAARDIRRGADEYADQVLASLDASLGKALAAVQKGRQTLSASTLSGNGERTRETTPA